MINDTLITTEIGDIYNKIDNKWLKLHYNTAVRLAVCGLAVECVLAIVVYAVGGTSLKLEDYLAKYLIFPLCINSMLLLVGYAVMTSARVGTKVKTYAVSLLLVCIFFVFFMVHNIFTALFPIFTIPILLTVVYGSYGITTTTAFCSVMANIIGRTAIIWDPDTDPPFSSTMGIVNFVISLSFMFAFYAACVVVIRFEKEKNAAAIQKEIERRQLQKKLMTDALTDINNRTAFIQQMEQIEKDDEQNGYIFVMIDLDNFKMLNDRLGHDEGDQCLKDFAHILKLNCKDSLPFRLGGDEFCILFANQTLENVLQRCKTIQSAFGKRVAERHIDFPLSASFGIAIYDAETTVSELLRNADTALYCSKEQKNAIRVYEKKEAL